MDVMMVCLGVVAALGCAAIVTSFVAIFTLRHVIRSMDIFLSSILLTLLGNSAVVVLMPTVLYLASYLHRWDTLTCKMYLWVVTALRVNSMVSLVAISLERVLLIRRPGKYHYRATLAVCLGVAITWVVAMVLALVPVLGWSHFKYRESGVSEDESYVLHGYCTLFLHELHLGLGIGILVLEFACVFSSIVCVSDIYCHLRYLSKRTLFSSKSRDAVAVGRDCYADLKMANSPSHTAKIGHTNPAFKSISSINKTNELTSNAVITDENSASTDVTGELPLGTVQGSVQFAAALDSCKIVIVALAVMVLMDHIPYTVLTTYGIVHNFDTHIGQVVMMWLYSFESIAVAACLWLFNVRYRKAHVRIFTCWCRGQFFLKEDDDVIADVHNVKYLEPPDYASHKTRYHDTSKMVHKTILNDKSLTSQSQHCYTNDVMASTSTSSNGSAHNMNASSGDNATSSQETLENTGDTQEIDLSSMVAAHKVHARHLREQVSPRNSNSDAPSEDSDTNSYLSLRRFVNRSSDDLGTPLTGGVETNAETTHENSAFETGEDYEVLQAQNYGNNTAGSHVDIHREQSQEIRLNQKHEQPGKESNVFSHSDLPGHSDGVLSSSAQILGPKEDVMQQKKADPTPNGEPVHVIRTQDSVDSVDVSQVQAYTLDDIEEALETSRDRLHPDTFGARNTDLEIALYAENENRNNSNEVGSECSVTQVTSEDGEAYYSCESGDATKPANHEFALQHDLDGREKETINIREDSDEFDEIFQYKRDSTALSLADELREAHFCNSLENDSSTSEDEKYACASPQAGSFVNSPVMEENGRVENDQTSLREQQDARLSTVY